MRIPRARFLTLLVVFAPLLPACVAVAAGAGAGYLIHREVTDDSHSAQVQQDVDLVWASVRETLAIDADLNFDVEVTDFPRVAETRIDGADVRVEVEAYDIDRTLVRVQAARYDIANDSPLAERTLDRILKRLE